jgi:hypothetical protein
MQLEGAGKGELKLSIFEGDITGSDPCINTQGLNSFYSLSSFLMEEKMRGLKQWWRLAYEKLFSILGVFSKMSVFRMSFFILLGFFLVRSPSIDSILPLASSTFTNSLFLLVFSPSA